MTDNADAPPSGPTKLCRVCSYPMPATAKKCTKCDSWQRWSGELGLSSEVLAMAVALLSVAGVVVPLLVDNLTPAMSKISINILKVESSQDATEPNFALDTFVSNSGSRPGLVDRDVKITAIGARGEALEGNTIRRAFEVPQSPQVIEPGKSVMVQIQFNTLTGTWIDAPFRQCRAILNVVNFDGSESNPPLDFDCKKLARLNEMAREIQEFNKGRL